jgi:hypothetical protein
MRGHFKLLLAAAIAIVAFHTFVAIMLCEGTLHLKHKPIAYGLGESMGAAVLLQALHGEPRLCAVAVESPYASFREVALDRLVQKFAASSLAARMLLTPLVAEAFLYARLPLRNRLGPRRARSQRRIDPGADSLDSRPEGLQYPCCTPHNARGRRLGEDGPALADALASARGVVQVPSGRHWS